MLTGHALGLMTSGGWHGNRWARLTAPPLTCIKFVADSEREFCTHCYILLLLLYDYYNCWRNVANVDVVVICWCRVSQSVMFLGAMSWYVCELSRWWYDVFVTKQF